MNIVSIKGLTKTFGNKIAVNSLDLNIKSGEIYGLLGPNGAGKSTIINIICGLLKSDKGDINIFSKDFKLEKTFIKGKIGVVPQELAIYEDLTALENVTFFASLYGIKGKELKEKSIKALEFVGLKEHSKEMPKNFSGGMKRRLNIACAIVHTPELIIMDEPTVGIDPQSRNHIISSIKTLNKEGSTIIYTTHYMGEVESLCTKIGIIDNGILIAEGTLDELKSVVSDKTTIKISIKDINNIKSSEILGIKGVGEVDFKDSAVLISYKKEVMCLDKIINYFTSKNLEIINIEIEDPDLETVFLKLTGRKLRD